MPARKDIKSICVLGSGPVVIGQAAEFDYSGTQAIKALKEDGYRIVLVNSNPATIMTDPELADATYIEPLVPEVVKEILRKERPDAILPTVGGQTALNLACDLAQDGTLAELGIELIGADIAAIKKAEDRQLFKETMAQVGLETLKSKICRQEAQAMEALAEYGLPIVIRPSFTLGGSGSGIAYTEDEFLRIFRQGISLSPVGEVLVEESALGWKEYEYEVMRDGNDNAVIVCSIENLDPMGVHTGDSITVAPAQTLTDREYQVLRDASLLVLRAVGVKTGGSNVQFAVNPKDGRFVVIEMNPRVSRSSALASKATGYPIAKVAAKVAVGYTLDEITNDITRKTKAAFEPSIDYVVVKVPRFAFEKFPGAKRTLTTQMRSVGESMAMGRNLKEALNKALASLEYGVFGIEADGIEKIGGTPLHDDEIRQRLQEPTPERLWVVAEALRRGMDLDTVHQLCAIDPWFLAHISEIVKLETQFSPFASPGKDLLFTAKQWGFTDARLAQLLSCTESEIRTQRKSLGIIPVFKRVDTCAAEFEAFTPYFYSTYESSFFNADGQLTNETEAKRTSAKKVIVLGSGPIRIGQGIEFDYCSVQAAAAFRKAGLEAIMVNCNPETVSTDYDSVDRLYFEPLTFEHVMNVIDNEQPDGVVIQFGGQTPLKLAKRLEAAGVPIWGTSPDAIDRAEDRGRSSELVTKLGLLQPPSHAATSVEDAMYAASSLGYPLLLRPSYVLGGRAMELVYDEVGLTRYLTHAVKASEDRPVLIDRFLDSAVEVDIDLVCDGHDVLIGGVMQHIQEAGVHSGDSACVIPPHSLKPSIVKTMCDAARAIALELHAVGLVNFQFAIQHERVYVLEVNPRASRTVPFVSKAVGLPLAQLAARVMAGQKLAEMGIDLSAWPKLSLPFVAVKEAVMPFIKFPGAETLLGPEMRSTGEVMGIAANFPEAFHKSQLGSGINLPLSGNVFISLAEPDKKSILPAVRLLYVAGFTFVATSGTHNFLAQHGIPSKRINKVREGEPHILQEIDAGRVQLMFNTTLGPRSVHDSYLFRRKAIEMQIPYYTTIESADAACIAIAHRLKDPRFEVKSLQDHQRGITDGTKFLAI